MKAGRDRILFRSTTQQTGDDVHDIQPPRIGLTTYRERAAWGVWNELADLLQARVENDFVT